MAQGFTPESSRQAIQKRERRWAMYPEEYLDYHTRLSLKMKEYWTRRRESADRAKRRGD